MAALRTIAHFETVHEIISLRSESSSSGVSVPSPKFWVLNLESKESKFSEAFVTHLKKYFERRPGLRSLDQDSSFHVVSLQTDSPVFSVSEKISQDPTVFSYKIGGEIEGQVKSILGQEVTGPIALKRMLERGGILFSELRLSVKRFLEQEGIVFLEPQVGVVTIDEGTIALKRMLERGGIDSREAQFDVIVSEDIVLQEALNGLLKKVSGKTMGVIIKPALQIESEKQRELDKQGDENTGPRKALLPEKKLEQAASTSPRRPRPFQQLNM